jgi:eukaryotic-like serine/threonine-protein kinase
MGGSGNAIPNEDLTPWRPGLSVDRYELVEQIGEGGMATVWSARDVALGREVALKLIRRGDGPPSMSGVRVLVDESALAEARTMARLSHPNVVAIYDVRPTEQGLFIAMERIRGGTLADWLRSSRRTWREVVAKFIAAGRGLSEAHRAGIVHRDFKPENVLLSLDGVARVSDFGIALPLDETHEREHASSPGDQATSTRDGAIPGTLPYMAPEQLLGRRVTARSDQFSFCVALYEALHGVRPFGSPSGAASAAFLLSAIVGRRIAPPSPEHRVPERLRRIVIRGLACDPDERWPSMDALVGELEVCWRWNLGRSRLTGLGISAIATLARRVHRVVGPLIGSVTGA